MIGCYHMTSLYTQNHLSLSAHILQPWIPLLQSLPKPALPKKDEIFTQGPLNSYLQLLRLKGPAGGELFTKLCFNNQSCQRNLSHQVQQQWVSDQGCWAGGEQQRWGVTAPRSETKLKLLCSQTYLAHPSHSHPRRKESAWHHSPATADHIHAAPEALEGPRTTPHDGFDNPLRQLPSFIWAKFFSPMLFDC